MTLNSEKSTQPNEPPVALAALRWVSGLFWCSRRERARRFVTALLQARDTF